MDKKYWNKFYKKDTVTNKHSDFAEFCFKEYIPQKSTILELGSGNLRDAYFFSINSHFFHEFLSFFMKMMKKIFFFQNTQNLQLKTERSR